MLDATMKKPAESEPAVQPTVTESELLTALTCPLAQLSLAATNQALTRQDVFKDPVTTPFGITYERANIEAYISQAEHRYDPADPEKKLLTKERLVTNTHIKKMIERLLALEPTNDATQCMVEDDFICVILQSVYPGPILLTQSGISYDQNSLKRWIYEKHKEPLSKIPCEIANCYPDKTLMSLRDLLWKFKPELKPSEAEIQEANTDLPQPVETTTASAQDTPLVIVLGISPGESGISFLTLNVMFGFFRDNQRQSLLTRRLDSGTFETNRSNDLFRVFKNYFLEAIHLYRSIENSGTRFSHSIFYVRPTRNIAREIFEGIQTVNTFDEARIFIRDFLRETPEALAAALVRFLGVLFNKFASNNEMVSEINRRWFANSEHQLQARANYLENSALLTPLLNEIRNYEPIPVLGFSTS